jgi:hypothetical protein
MLYIIKRIRYVNHRVIGSKDWGIYFTEVYCP